MKERLAQISARRPGGAVRGDADHLKRVPAEKEDPHGSAWSMDAERRSRTKAVVRARSVSDGSVILYAQPTAPGNCHDAVRHHNSGDCPQDGCQATERWSGAGRRRCLVREIRWPLDHRHGNWQAGSLHDVSAASLRLLAGGEATPPLDPQRCLFLDTETTGLAAGAGTVVFLTGCVWLEQGRLVLRHLFAPDFPGEAAMIDELAKLLEQFSCLVTFNGKSYDLPLLQTRFTLHRKWLDTSRWAQIDLLHAARILWKRPLGACSLVALERKILGFHRVQDIPSHSIPRLYFEFVRRRRLERLRGVFDHNMWDLLTCAGLLSRVAPIVGGTLYGPLSRPALSMGDAAPAGSLQACGLTPQIDHVRLARLLWSRGETARALDHCRLAGDWSGLELEGQIRKRVKDPRARQTWEELIRRPEYRGLQAFWELSMLAERQEKNPQLALQLLEQALARRPVGSEEEFRKLLRRKERLRKTGRRE